MVKHIHNQRHIQLLQLSPPHSTILQFDIRFRWLCCGRRNPVGTGLVLKTDPDSNCPDHNPVSLPGLHRKNPLDNPLPPSILRGKSYRRDKATRRHSSLGNGIQRGSDLVPSIRTDRLHQPRRVVAKWHWNSGSHPHTTTRGLHQQGSTLLHRRR